LSPTGLAGEGANERERQTWCADRQLQDIAEVIRGEPEREIKLNQPVEKFLIWFLARSFPPSFDRAADNRIH
jgi:hypothetical protein